MNLKKRNVYRIICITLITGFALCANAQEKRRLSPDEAVQLAINNNLTLSSSMAGIATKQRASEYSWNQFIPNVTLGGSLILDNEKSSVSTTFPIPGTGTPFSFNGISGIAGPSFFVTDPIELSQWHMAGSIQASLNLNVPMFENMRRLQLDYDAGKLGFDKAKAQLERDIRKAYHNILLVQENINLLRGSFENADRQVQMAQANYRAGLVPELTLLQAQVSRENMRPVIDQAENGLKLSMAQFAMYLGLDYNTQFELIPVEDGIVFIPLDISDIIPNAAVSKPEIKELKQNILMLESARKMQTYSLLPGLTLSWNGTSAFIKDPWKDSWFDSKDDWKNSGALTIALGVRLHSLLPWSSDYQGIKNFDDQIKNLNINLKQLKQGTEIEIYNTVLLLEKTRISTEALAQTVNLAERSYKLTEQAYQAGLQDLFQVQSSELSLRQARVQMLEQQFNYLNGLIDLEYSMGVPFGTLNKKGSK